MSRRTALYLFGVVAVGLNALLVWPWLGRVLTIPELAAFISVAAVAAVLSPVAVVGFHSFILRFLAGGTSKESAFARAAVPWACMASCLVCAAGTLLILIGLAEWGMVAVWIGMSSAGLVAAAVLRGIDAPRSFSAHAVATQTGALVALGAHVQAGASIVAAVTLAGVLATVGSAAVATRHAMWRDSLVALNRAARFSVPLVPHLVLAVGLVQFMRVLVASTGPARSVAEFQFAALVAGGAITVVQGLAAHVTTDALRAAGGEFEASLNRAWSHLLHASTCALCAIAVFVWVALAAWLPAGMERQSVAVAIAIMAPAVICQAVGDIGSASLMRENRSGLVSLATAGGALAAGMVYALSATTDADHVHRAALGVVVGLGTRAALAAQMARPFIRIAWRPSALLAMPVLMAILFSGAYYGK